tara:strand:- start:386 stop:568 length:183 start_codon:yes stop_codon:yes gene_type:complete
MKKAKTNGKKQVDHGMFTNKDGLLNGGVEVKATSFKETQSVQVGGQKRMLPEKKSKAEWY